MPPWAGMATAVLGTHVQLTRPQAALGFTPPHAPCPRASLSAGVVAQETLCKLLFVKVFCLHNYGY